MPNPTDPKTPRRLNYELLATGLLVFAFWFAVAAFGA